MDFLFLYLQMSLSINTCNCVCLLIHTVVLLRLYLWQCYLLIPTKLLIYSTYYPTIILLDLLWLTMIITCEPTGPLFITVVHPTMGCMANTKTGNAGGDGQLGICPLTMIKVTEDAMSSIQFTLNLLETHQGQSCNEIIRTPLLLTIPAIYFQLCQ